MAKFSAAEWKKINQLEPFEPFGSPERREKSVVIGTFNIRKLGTIKNRSSQAWSFLERICKRFDLLAVQEVMDNLEGLRHLQKALGEDYGIVVSDVTGGVFNPEDVIQGKRGNNERLAFLFNWKRIRRTELASDISYDRTDIVNKLFQKRSQYLETWEKHHRDVGKWEQKCEQAQADGKRKPKKPPIELPTFLTFIRQPHCASFEVVPQGEADPLQFLSVNAHLLYGTNRDERRWEFDALIDWLTIRAKNAAKMYYPNIVLLGDCNLEFEAFEWTREEIDARLKKLNTEALRSKRAAKVNFPLLTSHPAHGELRTSARLKQTYDQIGIFAHDKRWPLSEANKTAGQIDSDGFDYGVFNFTELFAQALYGRTFAELTKSQGDEIIKRCEYDVSDHMPAWFRLPIPGAVPDSR
jgi:endonuclease/exonuclease/phosphatase family metal-dependent hydrolase